MSETKKFASQADLEEKKITFSQISEHAWAYTAEGDPNTGIVIGDDCVLVGAIFMCAQHIRLGRGVVVLVFRCVGHEGHAKP